MVKVVIDAMCAVVWGQMWGFKHAYPWVYSDQWRQVQ